MKTNLIPMFLIVLMVSLPIYSSSTWATLSNIRAYGNDNVDGYLKDRNTDTLNIEVDATVSGVPLEDESFVRLGGNPVSGHFNVDSAGRSFDSCSAGHCIYQSTTLGAYTNPQNLHVYLYSSVDDTLDASDGVDDHELAEIIFDEIEPEIELFRVTPDLSNGGNITMGYRIEEKACTGAGCNNKCSGIDRIELTHGSWIETIYLNMEPDNCNYENVTVEDADVISPVNGDIEIRLTVWDNVGRSSSATDTFTLDTSRPIIHPETFRIYYRGTEQNVTDVKNETVPVDVRIDISSDNLDQNTVKADLTNIKINAPASYEDMPGSCLTDDSVLYHCQWQVDLLLEVSRNVRAIVNASDTAGNSQSATMQSLINYDDMGPDIVDIETFYKDSMGNNYMGTFNNTLIVDFVETGIGVNATDMFLDLTLLNRNPHLVADKCTSDKCYWFDVPAINPGKHEVMVTSDSQDILGNKVIGNTVKNITVDIEPPEWIDEISIVHIGTPAYREIKTGDSLDISVNVTDNSTVMIAKADFSNFIEDDIDHDKESLNQVDNKWSIRWRTNPINIRGHINDTIEFSIKDAAGNMLEEEYRISVLGLINETEPNLWEHIVSCSPTRIDRQLTPLVNHRVYCKVNLLNSNQSSGDQETMSIESERCVDRTEGSYGFIKDMEIMNNQRSSTEPYLNFKLVKQQATLDAINIKCPLRIVTRAGDEVTENHEVEDVNIDIQFYNLPMGEIGDNLRDKIDEVKDDKIVSAEWLGTLEEILYYVETFCRFMNHLKEIGEALEWISVTLGAASDTVSWLKGASLAATQAADGQQKSANLILYWGYRICLWASCRRDTLWGDWYTQIQGQYQGNAFTNWLHGIRSTRGFYGLGDDWFRRAQFGAMWPASPKDSLILSIATGCLTGIIGNINKWRQIQCNYGVCLLYGTMNNIGSRTCESQRKYLECQYLWSEAFHFFGLAAFQQFMANLMSIFADPLSTVFAGINFACTLWVGEWRNHWVCAIPHIIETIAVIGDDIANFGAEGFEPQENMCELFEDMYDEYYEED